MDLRRTFTAVAAAAIILGASAAIAPVTAADDACALLTQAQVSAVLGVTVEPGKRLVASSPLYCGWSEPGGPTLTAKKVVLTLMTTRQFDLGKTPMQGTTKTPVSGIGDDAYSVTAPGLGTALSVRKGSFLFQVKVGGAGFSADKIKAMERTLALEVLTKA